MLAKIIAAIAAVPEIIDAVKKFVTWAEKVVQDYKEAKRKREMEKSLEKVDQGDQRELERVLRGDKPK